jgi:hypothetical protein
VVDGRSTVVYGLEVLAAEVEKKRATVAEKQSDKVSSPEGGRRIPSSAERDEQMEENTVGAE